jgi:CxxC motif-containing protein
MKNFILKTNGSSEEYNPRGREYSLGELQTAVRGYIQIVRLPEYRVMVVNDDGHPLKLDINIKATKIYQEAYKSNWIIVGDVLVCDSKFIK